MCPKDNRTPSIGFWVGSKDVGKQSGNIQSDLHADPTTLLLIVPARCTSSLPVTVVTYVDMSRVCLAGNLLLHHIAVSSSSLYTRHRFYGNEWLSRIATVPQLLQ